MCVYIHTHIQTNVCNIIIYAYYRLTSLTEILITNHIAQFDALIFFFLFDIGYYLYFLATYYNIIYTR